MARKKIVKKKADTKAKDTGPADHRFRKYCLVLLLTCVVILSWLSLLTASPEDLSGQWIYPSGEINNAAGIVGAYLADWLLHWLGGGAYMALLFATVGYHRTQSARPRRDASDSSFLRALATAALLCAAAQLAVALLTHFLWQVDEPLAIGFK